MNKSSFNIYNASAGSGKTYSLVKNYLKVLLLSKQREPFKNILAITFTNKAVAEMKERIVNALKDFSSPEIVNSNNDMFLELCKELNIKPEQLHQKAKNVLYAILKNYAAFDVSTIDKFTQKIIRTFAFDLKLPLNFEVELDTDSMLSKAVDNLISRAGTDEELTKLLIEFAIEKTDDDKSWDVAYDFNKIAKLLVSENDIPHLETLRDKSLDDFAKLKTLLKSKLSNTETLIKEQAQYVLTLIEEAGLQFDDFLSGYLPKFFVNLSQLNLNVNFGLSWQNKLTEGDTLYPKRVLPEVAETIDTIQPELIKAFNVTKKLIFEHKFLSNFYKNITPLSVLHLINQELNLIKEEDNKLLISEFNTLISDEIKNQPAPFIYERIGEKFKHYFIDEFQDTSKMQWDNLTPLIGNALSSENASAMIVGDAKQAIYRWRGGQAEQFMDLYNKTRNPFIQINPEIISLDTNYRSSEAIIKFNNSFFQHISTFAFSQTDYSNLYQNSAQDVSSNRKGYVDLSFVNIAKEDDRNEMFSEQVYTKIQQCINDGYNYSDICVLVRKTKEGIAVANYLSEQGVEIVSSETLALSRSPEVNFIVDSLQFLMNPNSKDCKVQVLRFLSGKLEVSNKHEFYSERINLNIDYFYKSLNQFGIDFAPNEALQLPIYELVETIIYHFKLSEDADAYVQFFLNFVFNFSNKNSASISDFLTHYKQKREQLKINSSGGNAVQIMTIHKSKGLEFPVVIFPYADLDIYKELEPKTWFTLNEKEFNGFSQTLLSYNKDIAEYDEQGLRIYNEHQAELELDNINLLYVALTRAIERLYIISSISLNAKGELTNNDKKYSGFFINYLQHINKWEDNKLTYTFGEKEMVTSTFFEDTIIQNRFISIPKKEHQINILTKAGLLWDTSQIEAIEKGNLFHEIMAQVKTIDDISFTLESFTSSGTINEEQKEELSVLMNSIVEHPKLKNYFSKNVTVYNERDIITKNGIILRPDRLVINDKNEVVIIDYKTGKPDKKHEQQLQTYHDALEDMNFLVTYKILIYLNESLEIKEV
ncbi:MAG: UvrD-helicase domain-containing protein [Flavobacteriaceae bacterium]